MMSLSKEDTLVAIRAAKERITDTILQTSLLKSQWLSVETGSNVYLKMESEQITGSFKLRGATNKLKYLYETAKEAILRDGVVTASSGNHGIACAYISSQLGIKLSIYSYQTMAKAKEENILRYKNVELTKYGSDCCEAELEAKSQAEKSGKYYISPYNDINVIHGQGTIGLELLQQCKDLHVVIVPVGGGGLISGIALCIKYIKPEIKIIGCQPVNDCCMYKSIKAGRILEDDVLKDTFSDGTAGHVEPGSVTFEICQNYVDEWVLLEEEEIERAVHGMLDKEKKLVEGAAGLVVAAALKLKDQYQNRNIALIICGAQIGIQKINYIVKKYGEK